MAKFKIGDRIKLEGSYADCWVDDPNLGIHGVVHCVSMFGRETLGIRLDRHNYGEDEINCHSGYDIETGVHGCGYDQLRLVHDDGFTDILGVRHAKES